MKIGKYSFGIGDRFSHEGEAQLKAVMRASKEFGIDIVPVWNKSNREHQIVNTQPSDTRHEADAAVKVSGYDGQYFVDADHINMNNVDRFIDASDFFTIDVADYIGKPVPVELTNGFVAANMRFVGTLRIPGIAEEFTVTEEFVRSMASRYLFAVREAGRIYRHIAEVKGADNFVTEISMDEVEAPQTPLEMLFILSAIAQENIPVQTIAPKFTGRFNKGVDYVGDVNRFANEFEQDILVIDYAVKEFGLPENLKLSIHSGSDKFSIYPSMGSIIRKYDKGIHIKTAGTTWLEEIIGLALSDDKALELAKKIAVAATGRIDELCAPYATVIDIDKSKLPSVGTINSWTGEQFAHVMRHNPEDPQYNPSFRQLIHVSYKIAAECGDEFYPALERNKETVGAQVIENLLQRHIRRLFI